MAYHKFYEDRNPDRAYGSFETFYSLPGNGAGELDKLEPGWYWWACFPGCLPDGDPNGPFDTEQAAIDDAQEKA